MRTGVGSKGEVRQMRQKRMQRGADRRKAEARTEKKKMQGRQLLEEGSGDVTLQQPEHPVPL